MYRPIDVWLQAIVYTPDSLSVFFLKNLLLVCPVWTPRMQHKKKKTPVDFLVNSVNHWSAFYQYPHWHCKVKEMAGEVWAASSSGRHRYTPPLNLCVHLCGVDTDTVWKKTCWKHRACVHLCGFGHAGIWRHMQRFQKSPCRVPSGKIQLAVRVRWKSPTTGQIAVCRPISIRPVVGLYGHRPTCFM